MGRVPQEVPLCHKYMSRTNHYRLCNKCTVEPECWLCQSPWRATGFKPRRAIDGRRPWKRDGRFPAHSFKSHHNGPPRWWWQEKHAIARAKYRQMMLRDEDPALPRERDLIDLWSWY
jgi:hypothetical protein